MKKQNGITLIALIVTIIVMMILVGVTVATAINGGLFETARKAARDTQIEADKEALLGAVLEALDTKTGTLDVDNITNLPEGWRNNQDGTYTSPNGNTFKVGETGNIELDGENVNPNPENPGGDTDPDPVEPPEDEVDILAELKKYEGTSIIDFFAGGWDEANGCYRTNYPGLEETATYISYGCGIVRAFNEDNTHTDYIFTVKSDGATLDKVRVQPEVETIQISNGITAISNLEEFSFYKSGGSEDYSFGGLDVDISGGTDNHGATMYKNMTAGEGVNAIILTNVEYFNSLGEFGCHLDEISGIESIYVPQDYIGTIYIKDALNITFSGEGNPGGLEETLIGDKTYYKMSI